MKEWFENKFVQSKLSIDKRTLFVVIVLIKRDLRNRFSIRWEIISYYIIVSVESLRPSSLLKWTHDYQTSGTWGTPIEYSFRKPYASQFKGSRHTPIYVHHGLRFNVLEYLQLVPLVLRVRFDNSRSLTLQSTLLLSPRPSIQCDCRRNKESPTQTQKTVSLIIPGKYHERPLWKTRANSPTFP